MQKLFKQLTAITLLTTGLGITALSSVRADTGHGDHSAPSPAEVPHGEDHGGHEDSGTGAMPHGAGHGDHGDHGALEIPADQPVPTVSLTVMPDPVGGWNLEVQTENWTFAPERVNQANVPAEGHAHLYLNGEKLTRIYSNWYYLPGLPPGEHTLTVGLNANGHETLMHNGQPIEASVTMIVP
ncbi:MAG: hypothetical protein ACFBSF_20600 [Leptolyngbyaceae cyanobacterium]